MHAWCMPTGSLSNHYTCLWSVYLLKGLACTLQQTAWEYTLGPHCKGFRNAVLQWLEMAIVLIWHYLLWKHTCGVVLKGSSGGGSLTLGEGWSVHVWSPKGTGMSMNEGSVLIWRTTSCSTKWYDKRRVHTTLPHPPCWKAEGPIVVLCRGLRS